MVYCGTMSGILFGSVLKLAESEEDLLEHRTEGSDAFDTLYISCEKFPVHDIVNVPVSGVM